MHRLLPDRDGLASAYHALDAYVVPSRQEAGPKGVLESMATGVPLVTTRAGQAPDLVVEGRTATSSTSTTRVGSRPGSCRSSATRLPTGSAWPGADSRGELARAPGAAWARAARGLRGAPVDSERARATGAPRSRWARLLAAAAPPLGRVFYGWDRIPAPGEPVAGGTAKLQKLAERWPNRPADFSLLYLGTTYLPRDLRQLLWLARRRHAPSS